MFWKLMFFENKDNKKLVLSLAVYSSASILGPMLFLGALGFWLDKIFGSDPKFLLIFIGLAFVVSNVLLFKNQRRIVKKFKK